MGSQLVPSLAGDARTGHIDMALVACTLVCLSLTLFPEGRGGDGKDNEDMEHHIWGIESGLENENFNFI